MNIFKRNSINNQIVVAENPTKTMNQVIEEIHDTFYTEVDKLLEEANIAKSLDTDKKDLIEKSERLKALGFTNTKEVKETESEINRLNLLKKENESKKSLIDAINYFSFKYPSYRFITEKSVEKICAKYNLVYSTIDRYIGTVPDENLKHIETFKVLKEDDCYEVIDRIRFMRAYDDDYTYEIEYSKDRTIDITLENNFISGIYKKCPLEIVAPVKDFNMTGAELNGFKISTIEIPDPIVLKPVIFGTQKHYLIVTAWGLESTDTLVNNPIHN